MRVSVVIPTYNAANFLREAVQSALAQTFQPLEIIVVDDGSTDHTAEVCAAFGDRIRYFYQPNDGSFGASAHIRGILETRGDLIAFLDHDDRWLPTKIEKQLRALEAHPDAGAVFTPHRTIDGSGQLISPASPAGPSGELFHQLLKGNFPYYGSSALVRRQALARGGIHDVDMIAGDWDQWLRIARYFPILIVDEGLTEYRIHNNNFSSDKMRLARGSQLVLERHKSRLHPNCSECEEAFREGWSHLKGWRKLAARQYLDDYYSATRTGDLGEALPFLWKAFRASPREVLRPLRIAAISKNGALAVVRGSNNGQK